MNDYLCGSIESPKLIENALQIMLTKNKQSIREIVDKNFGRFSKIIIDVDGDKHEYDADTIISLLEKYELKD